MASDGVELDTSYYGDGNHKPKIVVIMGPTGSGKSRLAIDLASHFPIEIINTDSMQVYHGLDVLTNKVTVSEQKGVKHHLLGTISPDIEFTCKDFRDAALPLINDIISRDHLPVIVGGTNFYIQALVSPFLLDDQVDDVNDDPMSDFPEDGQSECDLIGCKDQYVDQRVDRMIEAGLLEEVCDVYMLNADYTRGLRQAIGVREFEDFLKVFLEIDKEANCLEEKSAPTIQSQNIFKVRLRDFLKFSSLNDPKRCLLEESISKLKVNTRRLIRRQRRRVNRLQKLFGWSIYRVDSTETLLGSSDSSWISQVVEPSVDIIGSFLNDDPVSLPDFEEMKTSMGANVIQRDLWTQYVCEACGNRVLRGSHEWEQHRQGRAHRKRVARLRRRTHLASNLTPLIPTQE